uniref:Kazal-like domain-containing protein n=1 Tax=Mola mola TaxID=94237 RepID=A0A3Q3XMM4_MOLML
DDRSHVFWQPSCHDSDIVACPRNFDPVCGSDGNTYTNECMLCFERQRNKKDILIVKQGAC